VSQLQGDSAPTKLMETGDIVHLALWSPLLCRTRCGVSLIVGDERVDEPISCMTCLVKADVFEIPLRADKPATNPDGELVWCKQVFGPSYNYITECCYTEDPCDYHKPIEP
jgi:hypothetical protein